MFSIHNISLHFTGNNIFRNIGFLINPRDRIGLVGRNGSGKTSLLRIINGDIEPESGEVVIPSGQKIGFLPQEMVLKGSGSIKEEAMSAFEEALALDEKINHITAEIGSRTDYESASYIKLIEQLNNSNERFQIIGGHTMEADTEKVLIGLGFSHDDFHRPMGEFSGGWQMRVELAKVLLSRPDLLMLDEPTNHLDIESIQWLEAYLKDFSGALVLVSHDRAFLDNITKRTIEISRGSVYDYKAAYSEYVRLREEQMETQQAAYENQQKEIKDIERFVERFRYKATKARQVQSRIKHLEKMEKVELDHFDTSAIHFSFPPAPRAGKIIVTADKLSKAYGSNTVLNDVEFVIKRNDFVAFVGRNGEGKSTLSKIIAGVLDYNGGMQLGHNVSIGYFAQNQAQLLDQNKTVFETIDDIAVGDLRPKVRGILGSFLFSDEDIEKKVSVLSGGEKSRLAIAAMLLNPVNLLIMDEPTNHLDMVSKDILKNALLKYDGTLIIVSHDRDFLAGLTDKVFEFRNNKVKEHLGDIYDFLEYRKIQNLVTLEKQKKQSFSEGKNAVSENKRNYIRRKEFEREERKILKQIADEEKTIEELEKQLAEKDAFLANPASNSTLIESEAFFKEYENIKAGIEKAMEQWEQLQHKLEKQKRSYGDNS